jgi:hypothetical protein
MLVMAMTENKLVELAKLASEIIECYEFVPDHGYVKVYKLNESAHLGEHNFADVMCMYKVARMDLLNRIITHHPARTHVIFNEKECSYWCQFLKLALADIGECVADIGAGLVKINLGSLMVGQITGYIIEVQVINKSGIIYIEQPHRLFWMTVLPVNHAY